MIPVTSNEFEPGLTVEITDQFGALYFATFKFAKTAPPSNSPPAHLNFILLVVNVVPELVIVQ
ncbi:hypothetical protein D3C83_133850 [compost metagenome]